MLLTDPKNYPANKYDCILKSSNHLVNSHLHHYCCRTNLSHQPLCTVAVLHMLTDKCGSCDHNLHVIVLYTLSVYAAHIGYISTHLQCNNVRITESDVLYYMKSILPSVFLGALFFIVSLYCYHYSAGRVIQRSPYFHSHLYLSTITTGVMQSSVRRFLVCMQLKLLFAYC